MAYATQQQVQIAAGGSAKLIELTDQEDTAAIDATVLAEAQKKAEGWMHGYLRLRHTVPVTNLSAEGAATMARLSADETVYQLRSAIPGMLGETDTSRRIERERELEAIREGKIRIDEPMPTKSSAVAAQFVENCGDVSREKLKGLL